MYNYRMLAEGLETQVRLLQEERDALAEKLAMAVEFLDHLGTPGSEPLNSVNGYRTKADRGYFTAQLRAQARSTLAAIKECGE